MKEYQNLTQQNLNIILNNACIKGKFKTVECLLTSPNLPKHADNIDEGFVNACRYGHLKIVKYLLTSPSLSQHADIQYENNSAFINACAFSYLNIVKYLLTSADLIGNGYSDIHACNDAGLCAACFTGDVEIVKYLLTAPKLIKVGHTYPDIHAQNDLPFISACKQNNFDGYQIIEYLIFDYGIKNTIHIQDFLSTTLEGIIILKMFEIKELEKKLQEGLSKKSTLRNKNKI